MSLRTAVTGGVARVTLDAPPLNVLTQAVLADLREALTRLAEASALRVVVLEAEGEHFSAGASVEEHLPGRYESMIPEFIETVALVRDAPTPTVAALQGRCLGGALEIALAADLRVAGGSALLGVPEIRLGVFPPAACAQLVEIDRGLAAEMILTGEPVSADRALRHGLVQRVVPDDRLDEEVDRLARSIARHSAASLRAAKRALRATSLAADVEEPTRIYLEELMDTRDAVEGLTSFVEKRRPEWSHA